MPRLADVCEEMSLNSQAVFLIFLELQNRIIHVSRKQNSDMYLNYLRCQRGSNRGVAVRCSDSFPCEISSCKFYSQTPFPLSSHHLPFHPYYINTALTSSLSFQLPFFPPKIASDFA